MNANQHFVHKERNCLFRKSTIKPFKKTVVGLMNNLKIS